MNQSNNTQKTLKPKNQKKYTEAVNLWPSLARFTISFASAGTCFGQPIIGCKEVDHMKCGSR
jgi:hypothetical protein